MMAISTLTLAQKKKNIHKNETSITAVGSYFSSKPKLNWAEFLEHLTNMRAYLISSK